MTKKPNCYQYYKKLLTMKIEKPVTETREFQALAKNYPHIAESIRLKTEMRRLKETLASAKDRQTRLQAKRQMNSIKAKLRREKILKQLHVEGKHERAYRTRFFLFSTKKRVSSLIVKGLSTSKKAYIKLQRKSSILAHRRLPPSIFDLRSLDLTEKNLALKEWLQDRRKLCQSSLVRK